MTDVETSHQLTYDLIGPAEEVAGLKMTASASLFERATTIPGAEESFEFVSDFGEAVNFLHADGMTTLGIHNKKLDVPERADVIGHALRIVTVVEFLNQMRDGTSLALSVRFGFKPNDEDELVTRFKITRPDQFPPLGEDVRNKTIQAMGSVAKGIGLIWGKHRLYEEMDAKIVPGDNTITLAADPDVKCGMVTMPQSMLYRTHIELMGRGVTRPEQQLVLFAGAVGLLQAAGVE